MTDTTINSQRRPWLSERGILVVFLIAVTIRWIFSAIRELVPDEAYYWVWSRHLAMSYFDHPPMVAYLIKLGTLALGQTELGVRWPAGLLAMGGVVIAAALARKIFDDARPAAFVAVMLFVSPLVNVMGSVMTPDTPACFFQIAALSVAIRIFLPSERPRGPMWLLFGFFMGLALLSKYTSVILGGCIFLAMLTSPDGRRHFRSPWPWLAGILAFAMFTPVIVWNSRNHWASFVFQADHGMGQDTKPWWNNLLTYIGGQIGVATPVLFVMIIVAIIVYLKRWKSTPMHVRVLLISTLLPLLFFAFSSLRRVPEANWPVFTYYPGTLLVAHYLLEKWNGARVSWARIAAIVAAIGTIFIHAPELVWLISPGINVQSFNDMFGWRELADEVHKRAAHRPVFAQDYHLAAEMSFYLPGQPEVWQVMDRLPGVRWTQYDYLPDRPDPTKYNSIALVRKPQRDIVVSNGGRDRQYIVYIFNQEKQGHQIRRTWIEIGQVEAPTPQATTRPATRPATRP